MGLGFELAVATVYIVEIASTDMRGILGCFVQFMGSFGVLFTYILGSFLNWYYLALVNGLSVIIFVIGNKLRFLLIWKLELKAIWILKFPFK